MIDTALSFDSIALRIGVAALFGLILGFDREWHDKPAGLRTHMLISLAAAVFTVITFELVHLTDDQAGTIRAGPLRLIEAVVTGVAFLGAGAIIQARDRVTGVTTGASMWLAGALGIACGMGLYATAALVMGLGLLVLTVLGLVERRITRARKARDD